MGLEIATGQMTDSPAGTLPLDASGAPGVAPPTPVAGQLTPADQGGVRDLAGERLGQLAGYEQDIAAAQHAGMSAREAMLSHYQADLLPQGSSYGDEMALPEVPEAATGPASGFLYPWSGLEPTPAGAGLDYTGNEPKPAA